MGDQKFIISEDTLSRWSRLHLQWLALTNPHWAHVVGYDPFSLYVIHKDGLCPRSGDVNRLMMKDTYIDLHNNTEKESILDVGAINPLILLKYS
jgi:hypothetical protein